MTYGNDYYEVDIMVARDGPYGADYGNRAHYRRNDGFGNSVTETVNDIFPGPYVLASLGEYSVTGDGVIPDNIVRGRPARPRGNFVVCPKRSYNQRIDRNHDIN
ncbi:hypothetical protein SOVF_066740 [Spinacia oleracea]|nr:hypothetical protein SOVF_066740 [Spinacia oleracea]